ncbi:MAG: DUF2254 domain-containing protein [Cyanomargarita calcarea GSE-NOS-MK-12-04C]|uniref:DUF2254 domain-containing protein n=1 Tax=Cyanomargarita calcarea GSE-NOS-MK-12-04C TaxID=2839659 RepID=A0A951US66_9CYAN|nr:DUF2254 domain-containing protein [Cyanomargarita calcarea GSE-NOS-MK-12-04C]
MRNIKLSKLWDTLHSSYWFVPTLMAIASVGLAVTMLRIDRAGNYGVIKEWGWIYSGGPDGARALLSTVAGSLITVTGTAFSITIVALQLAASNFGPRLLRNFMQDTGNQLVLGTFISTFVYCLLVLRTIHGEDYDIFVPQLSVTVGMVLAFISICVLIYFIDHASTIIQASHVIKSASDELDRAIERLFPQGIGYSINDNEIITEIPANFEEEAYPIKATRNGYLQGIDDDELMQIACQHNLIVKILTRPGKFVVKGSNLVKISPGERINHKLTKKINDAFLLDKERTEQQDVEFPINQLVEIALRAISPGINDPFTAIRCIDRLSAGLSNFAQRDIPSPYRYDKNNNLRVIAEPVTFAGLTDAAFNQIRQYSTKDVAVTIRLLEAIACIATFTQNPKRREALRRHADMILQGSLEAVSCKPDCKDIQSQYNIAVQALMQN